MVLASQQGPQCTHNRKLENDQPRQALEFSYETKGGPCLQLDKFRDDQPDVQYNRQLSRVKPGFLLSEERISEKACDLRTRRAAPAVASSLGD